MCAQCTHFIHSIYVVFFLLQIPEQKLHLTKAAELKCILQIENEMEKHCCKSVNCLYAFCISYLVHVESVILVKVKN